jgi:hypothetical protein
MGEKRISRQEITEISYQDIADLSIVADEVVKALLYATDPFDLVIQENQVNSFEIIDFGLQKAIQDKEVDTIKKFSKNLHPEELKMIKYLLDRFEVYRRQIIEQIAELLGEKKRI